MSTFAEVGRVDHASPPVVSTSVSRPRSSGPLANDLILIAGATGYVGGRLLRRLEATGARLRALARQPDALSSRVRPGTTVVEGDVLRPETLARALEGVHTAYYLVHSMGAESGFEAKDRAGALLFSQAARRAGVRRIIYLGGLGHGSDLSPHLASRQEVGQILRASGVPVLEFRASIVLGSGSLSFELVRALVERLPVMVTPRWVNVRAQPIAVDDLLDYLVVALDLPLPASLVLEIGGADQVTYGDIMREYARQRGLRRVMVPVPVLTPRLSSLWLGLVTPVYARVGRKLVESIRHPTVVRDDAALQLLPVRPRGMHEAIAAALRAEDRAVPESRWSDAGSAAGDQRDWTGVRFGRRLTDSRTLRVAVPPAQAFAPIRRIGGRAGWYALDWLWEVRGFLDLLAGGVGVRRGRPEPENLRVGDALDFWRVEAYRPDALLRLEAEMRVPGRAWLEFEVTPAPPGGATLRQTATFDPVGWFGVAYWYALWPVHRLVFGRMLEGIAQAAERATTTTAG